MSFACCAPMAYLAPAEYPATNPCWRLLNRAAAQYKPRPSPHGGPEQSVSYLGPTLM
jgi:hypothetical protein